MNDIARYNYQRGVKENLSHESTTYNAESDLDRYVIARV